MKRLLVLAAVLAVCVPLAACTSGVREFVVAQRNHQGDLALSRGNLTEAKIGYRLALQLAPSDAHARDGLVDVLTRLAEQQYEHSDFEGALEALAQAKTYDPQSVRVAELHDQVVQARVKRQIVIANYPNFSATGKLITKSYQEIPVLNKGIVKDLQRFEYTYDGANLTGAIKQSYSLQEEITRLTQRLINYRQLIESGAPAKGADAAPSTSGSLLPVP
jgi:tetratricopeptide (TPR) repeat protein